MKPTLMYHRRLLLSLALVALSALVGCEDPIVNPAPSLNGPRSLAVANSQVCLQSVEVASTIAGLSVRACPPGERGAIGLIANQMSNRLAIVDMARPQPRLVDLDPAMPDVNHLPVGRGPVDVATFDNGAVAYTANQIDQSLSVVNLWRLEGGPYGTINLPAAPRKIAVRQDNGRIVVALSGRQGQPSSLWIHDGVQCFQHPHPRCVLGGVPLGALDGGPGDIDLPDADQFELAGEVSSMVLASQEDQLWVAYTDRNFASVVALNPFGVGDAGCLDGGDAPCEIARVGLTWECTDGLDNDDDGLADTADPQCFGPRGAESAEGVGREPVAACNNGLDDDADGSIDRDDANCVLANQDSEDASPIPEATFACGDGRDNDGDGLADTRDPGCYGRQGRTEVDLTTSGFAGIDIDPVGGFVYVVDRARGQVMVVDATRRQLVDAPRAASVQRPAFTDNLGVPVFGRPGGAAARVERRVIASEAADDAACDAPPCHRAVFRYDWGAFVASDNGFAYNLSALTTFCELTISEDPATLPAVPDPSAPLAGEAACLALPPFPLESDEEACRLVTDCFECRQGATDAAACEAVCAGIDQAEEACRSGRVEPADGGPLRTFDPHFEIQDATSRTADVRGVGTCSTPQPVVAAMRELAAEADLPADLSCTSPLRPQPVAPLTTDAAFAAGGFERADLLEDIVVGLLSFAEAAGGDLVDIFATTDDFAIRNELWSVTYEGVLPGTLRDDGLIAEDTPGLFLTGGLDLCEAGAREGDRLTILSEPGVDGDDLPQGCEVFATEVATARTWRVDAVTADAVRLSVIGESGDADRFVDELPSRRCFPTGLSYEIRPDDEWIAIGQQSGYISNRRSVLGVCVPKTGAGTGFQNSRVETGGVFQGPYLSFELRDTFTLPNGTVVDAVEPARSDDTELRYQFRVDRNYASDRLETFTILPTQAEITHDTAGRRFLVVPDVSENFVYLQSLTNPSADPILLQ